MVDLSPLRQCTALHTFFMDLTEIVDIAPLSGLLHLEVLVAAGVWENSLSAKAYWQLTGFRFASPRKSDTGSAGVWKKPFSANTYCN